MRFPYSVHKKANPLSYAFAKLRTHMALCCGGTQHRKLWLVLLRVQSARSCCIVSCDQYEISVICVGFGGNVTVSL